MDRSSGRHRIGVLGAGRVSRDMHLPVLRNMPDVSVCWICDQDKERARGLAKAYGVPSAFERIEECSDVDVVLVAIPVGARRGVMDHVFKRGWHAFCEKPFAASLSEYDEYVRKSGETRVALGVGLLRRYGPGVMLGKEIVGTGIFGPIRRIWGSEGSRTKRTGQGADWYMTDAKSAGGGVLMETGSHLVDQLCTILQVAEYELECCRQKRNGELEFETLFSGVVSNDSQENIRLMFHVSRLEDLYNGIFIEFPNLILKCGLFFEEEVEFLSPKGEPVAIVHAPGGARTLNQALYCEWQDFLAEVVTGQSSYVNANTGRVAAGIIEDCYKKAEVMSVSDTILR